jgi:AcrR family transcriptional regulator
MARPVNADAGATRARILEAAAGRFSDAGERGASIRDIAREAGVSLAMVHHYFGSKDQLYAACVEAMYVELEGLRDELLAAVAAGGDAAALVDRAVVTCFRFARSHRPALKLVMRVVVDTGEVPPDRRDAFLLPFLDQASLWLTPAGAEPARTRVAVQAVTFAVVRFALSTDAELRAVLGAAPECPLPDVLRDVERHLATITRAALGLAEPVPGDTP